MFKSKILILADSFKDYNLLIDGYVKQLKRQVDIIKIKPTKGDNISNIIDKNTKKVINLLRKDKNFKVLLSLNGECKTTEELVKIFSSKLKITFIIGGPYGLHEERLQDSIDLKLSFGKHTKNNLLVLLELLEQIYRIDTILKGKKYHY